VPVLAAGGIADGAGLAASLALGGDGVLLGTRFLATPEAPIPPSYKRAILRSDGHDTLLTEIADIAFGLVWPGAMSRVVRNRFIERWAGREWEVRQRRNEIALQLRGARERDDAEESNLQMGQTAGLITEIAPAGEIVRQIVAEAEGILRTRLPALLAESPPRPH
jgi:NAD(P)H-dependent flavin oxidoreductase YrpB (nitropropane dioxygenase family)